MLTKLAGSFEPIFTNLQNGEGHGNERIKWNGYTAIPFGCDLCRFLRLFMEISRWQSVLATFKRAS